MKSTWTVKGVYELDTFNNASFKKLVPLTEKNKDFIEGCIKLDSSYKSCISNLVSALRTNYSEEMILEIIKEINSVNSTRLSDEEMVVLSNRLSSAPFTSVEYLTNLLNGTQDDIKEIFIRIVGEISFYTSKGKERKRKNISFATKYIYFMSRELGCNAHLLYSKFDSKVANCLYDYARVYDVTGYSKNEFSKLNLSEEELWTLYIDKYNPCITSLIEAVYTAHGYRISRDEIDHLIWYTQK